MAKKIFFLAALLSFSFYIFLFYKVYFVFADAFFPSTDTALCQMASATSISYSNLPSQKDIARDDSGGISYDQSLLEGVNDPLFYKTHNFQDIASLSERYPNIATHVSVPPGTSVNIDNFIYNKAGETVSIPRGSILFTSLSDSTKGDMTNLGAPGTPMSAAFVFNSVKYVRSGKGVILPSLGSINNGETGSQRLLSFKTITPISIQRELNSSVDNTSGIITLNFTLTIQNQTAYVLNNLSIEDDSAGDGYTSTINMNPYEKKILNYSFDIDPAEGSHLTLAPAFVKDPNFHTETAAIGNTSLRDPNAVSAVILRDDTDGGSSSDSYQQTLVGSAPSDFLSVTLIPYTLYSNNNIIDYSPSFSITKKASADEITRGDKVSYTITVTNTGNSVASNTVILDWITPYNNYQNELIPLDGGVWCNNVSIPISALKCPNVSTPIMIFWDIGPLFVGESKSVHLYDQTTENTPLGYTLQDFSQVYSISTRDSFRTPVVLVKVDDASKVPSTPSVSNVILNKSVDKTSVEPGAILTYTISYANKGGSSPFDVIVEDPIPSNTSLIKESISGNGSYNINKNEVLWNIGKLSPNDSGVLQFKVSINFPLDDGTIISNTAFVNEGSIVSSNLVKVVVHSGYVQGRIWNDLNMDGKVDYGEPMISKGIVSISFMDMEGNMQKENVISDSSGMYILNGIPLDIPIDIHFQKLSGFSYMSTPDYYKDTLSENVGYLNTANFGLYNKIMMLPDTSSIEGKTSALSRFIQFLYNIIINFINIILYMYAKI